MKESGSVKFYLRRRAARCPGGKPIYYAIIRWTVSGRMREASRSLRTGTRPLARRRLAELEAEWDPRHVGHRELTAADAVTEYLQALKVTHRPLTLTRYRSILETFAVWYGGRVYDLTPQTIESWKLKRAREVRPATVNGELRTLSAFFSHCERLGYIKKNPARGVQRLRLGDPTPKIYTAAGMDRMLSDPDPVLAAVVRVLVNTGLREREFCTLRWPAVNWRKEQVRVTGKGARTRTVPLNRSALQALRVLWRRRRASRGFVLPSLTGKEEFHLARRLAPLGTRAGVHIRLHSFRHTFASQVLRVTGGNLKAVQALLGHRSLRTTMIYLHLVGGDEELRDAVRALDSDGTTNGTLDSGS